SFHAVLCAVIPPVLPQMTAVPSVVPIEPEPQITALPHDCGSVHTTLLPQITALALAHSEVEPQITALPHAVSLVGSVPRPQITALPQMTACDHDMLSPPIDVHGNGCGCSQKPPCCVAVSIARARPTAPAPFIAPAPSRSGSYSSPRS